MSNKNRLGRQTQALGTIAITPLPAPIKYICVSRAGIDRSKHKFVMGGKLCFHCDLDKVEALTESGQTLFRRRLRDALKETRGKSYGPRFDGPAD